jgi:ketosteroid isomerase-like protein
MTSAEDAIGARRKLTNRLIAAKDAQRLVPFLTADAVLIAGDGGPILGREAIVQAFAAQFADPAFIAYVRETARVTVDASGLRAAEHGRWTGRWRGAADMTGDYLAVWRKVVGQWLIERELYVTLS